MLLNRLRQPAQKGLELLVALFAIQAAADIPIRGMKKFHGVAGSVAARFAYAARPFFNGA